MNITDPKGFIARFPQWVKPWPMRYGFALLTVAAAALARYGLGLAMGFTPPFILFFPVILLVALATGFRPGIFATILSSVIAAYFFLEPPAFGISRMRDGVALLLFMAAGTAVCGLAELARRRATRLQEFERVVEGLEEMIVVVDRDYRYIIANEAFLKYRGVKAERILGHRVDEIIYPEIFRSTVKDKMDECFRGNVVQYEMQYESPSLGERNLFVSYFPIGRPGAVDRLACVLRDVTEKKRAVSELRESEDRYRDLVEHSEDLVCTHDLQGNLLSVNPAPARILGYEVAELLKIPMRDLIVPEAREQFDAYLEEIKTRGVAKGLLGVVTRRGERRIWEYSNTLRIEGVASPIVRGMAHDVTERQRAEAALRSSEQRYRLLFEQNVAGVAIANMDGEVVACNDGWAHILGYNTAEEVRGRRATEFYFNLADRAPLVEKLKREGAFFSQEMRLRRKDGTAVWVLFNCALLAGDTTGTVLVQATAIDITKRKTVEEALRLGEENYRNFVAQSSEGIFREDLDAPVSVDLPEDELIHHILHDSYLAECNDAMARMYGHPSAQGLLGKRLTEMLVVDDPRNVEVTREYIRSGFHVLERESHEVDIHGNPKVFRNSMIGIVEDGKLIRTWGIQRDVTEQVKLDEARKEAEAALRKSEEHFRLLVEQASDGIFLADSKGRYVDVNTAGAEMLGYSREEIVGLSLADVLSSEEVPRLAPEIARFDGGEVTQSEWKFRRKDGSIFSGEVCGRRLPDGRLQGILRDITERKNAEELMRRSEERFRVALKDSPITVFNQDRELRYTWIYNPRLYWQQNIIGKTDEELLGSRKAARLTELKQLVLKNGKSVREEIVVPHEGDNYAFDTTIEPLFGPDETIIGITGSSMDIAKLRQLADGLQNDKEKLARDKSYLEEEIEKELGFETIIGNSPALRDVLSQARVVAPTDSTVLLLGETGTGKELVARSVHALSSRRERNFIKLNCAAVPSGLLESELFGHEKGAFTGAVNQKVGRIELADQGTLFLDEIGELPPELQPKLLRVLQDREFERLGGVRTLRVDVRIVAATNRDLHQDIAERKFREDLFYRLNVFPIQLPPLRDRRSDIPMLVHHFMSRHATKMGKHIDRIPDESMDVLRRWNWPGNVRELENLIERMVILTNGSVLAPPPAELQAPQEFPEDNLTEMEREHIIRILRETGGVLSGAEGAASRLGMKRTTLQSMLKRLGIEAHEYRSATGTFGRG